MDNQKQGILHALEVLDSLKQSTVNADRVCFSIIIHNRKAK